MEQIVEIKAGGLVRLKHKDGNNFGFVDGGPYFTCDDEILFKSLIGNDGNLTKTGILLVCKTIAAGIHGLVYRSKENGNATRESIMQMINKNIDEYEKAELVATPPQIFSKPKDPYKVHGQN